MAFKSVFLAFVEKTANKLGHDVQKNNTYFHEVLYIYNDRQGIL